MTKLFWNEQCQLGITFKIFVATIFESVYCVRIDNVLGKSIPYIYDLIEEKPFGFVSYKAFANYFEAIVMGNTWTVDNKVVVRL